MLKLYGFQQSRSFRALWALEESGLEYEYVQVRLRAAAEAADSAKNPAYLALNSQGKVPTLVDGDLVLSESVAILYYIARSAPESGLLPNASMDVYARIDELACFVLAELEQPLWNKGKHWFALPKGQRIPQMFETAKFEFAKALQALDHLLGDGEYAVGKAFTLADILLAQTFDWAMRFEFELPQKHIDLRERHYRRPACQRALAVMA